MRFVIIGGSDAGIAAALRARELDGAAHITVILADAFPNYSICGLPFYVSGETPDWRQLAHRTQFEGIELLTNYTAHAFDPSRRIVSVTDEYGKRDLIAYDILLIATGARPLTPRIPGIDAPGVFPLHTIEDSFRLHRYLLEKEPQSAVIVGSGYIGLEMADALTHRGLGVTLIGRSKNVLATVDESFGRAVEETLRRHGVRVESDCEVHSFTQNRGRLLVHGSRDLNVGGELVLVAMGVEPNAVLGQKAGLRTGVKDALSVNRRMETDIPGVYAAGDCAETWHRLLEAYTYLPLGTTSHKQGRVAGENAVGGRVSGIAGNAGGESVRSGDCADGPARWRGAQGRISALNR